MLGTSKEAASNVGLVAMLIAVIIIFARFNKNKRKP
jgi:hypothetical protein